MSLIPEGNKCDCITFLMQQELKARNQYIEAAKKFPELAALFDDVNTDEQEHYTELQSLLQQELQNETESQDISGDKPLVLGGELIGVETNAEDGVTVSFYKDGGY